MAIDKKVWDQAKQLFEYGKSLSEIQTKTGINRSSISKKAKAEKWQKSTANSTLVEKEVDTIIKQKEINSEKSTLNQQQLILHNQEVRDRVDKVKFKAEIESGQKQTHDLAMKAQSQIVEYINADEVIAAAKGKPSYAAVEHLPNIMAIGKIVETVNKTIYGVTQPTEAEEENNDKQIVFNIDLSAGDKNE